MKKLPQLRDLLIACACLVGGFIVAAVVSPGRFEGGTALGTRQTFTEGSSSPSTGGSAAAVGSDGARAKTAPAAGLDAFAERWIKIEGEPQRIEALIAWLDTFGADDYAAFVNRLIAIDESDEEMSEDMEALTDWMFGENEIIGTLIFERWAAVAPESLGEILKAIEPEMAASVAAYALPFLWVRDPELAARIMAELKAGGGADFDDGFDEDIFVSQLYSMSEVMAVRWIIENSSSSDPSDVEWLFEAGIRDGEGILAELVKLGDAEVRSDALYAFFETYGAHDAGAARALLAGLDGKIDPDYRAELEEELEAAWMLEDPAARLDFVGNQELASEVLEEWTLANPQTALAWVQGPGREFVSDEAFGRIVGSHASTLPFDFLMEHGDLVWASLDDDWLRALSGKQLDQLGVKNELLDDAWGQTLSEFYRRDPDRALALADGKSFGWIAAQVGADAARREGWFEQISAEDRPALAGEFFGSWAREDPAEAFAAASAAGSLEGQEWAVFNWLQFEDVEKIYAAGADRFGDSQELLAAVARAWAKRDPRTAGETFLADGREAAVPVLIGEWVLRDGVEASAFIREKLVPGATRDAAVEQLVHGIAQHDPEAAREWAGTIDDAAVRGRAMQLLEQ